MQDEKTLELSICRQLLRVADYTSVDEIDPTENFDAYGLDSISRVGILTTLETEIGQPLAVESLLEAETPRQLAALIYSDISQD